MGKINQGVLGGFSGKVGTVVGASWKGIAYMRSMAESVKNPKSEGQVEHRSKFKLLVKFLAQFEGLFKTSFKSMAVKMSTFNAATKVNWAIQPFGGTATEPTLDHTQIVFGRGSLPGLATPTVTVDGTGIKLSYSDNSSEEGAATTDVVYGVIVDTASGKGFPVMTSALKRNSGTGVFFDAEAFEGQTLDVFAGLKSADGRNSSEIVYIGQAELA